LDQAKRIASNILLLFCGIKVFTAVSEKYRFGKFVGILDFIELYYL
jgi:hypothetical protein